MKNTIEKLLNGNAYFRQLFFADKTSIYRDFLEFGQRPEVLVIACSDSRVDPAVIFNSKPGDLFVIRNVANLVPPYESDNSYHGVSAALEFAVLVLLVKHIIILGHSQCGGIQALIEHKIQSHLHLVTKWMQMAKPAYEKVMKEHAQASLVDKIALCERHAIVNSLYNLRTFPWIKKRINSEDLILHGWYFDLATGGIQQYDEQSRTWLVASSD